MTTTATPAKTTRPVKKTKPNGQWAVDGTEPLNPTEVFKAEDNGLNVRQRIETIYAKEGFDAIAENDLRGRFRWWGLYTQRKQGIDGGQTAQLEPEELEDKYFMLRVRTDGAALNAEALRVLGGISTEFARGSADISDRQNLQYHWIDIKDVPKIWEQLATVNLDTTTACGDTPRGFLGSPVAGIAADEIIDPTPVINEIKRRYIGDPELTNLPRKYKTSITGHPSLDTVHEINDFSLVGVVHPELGPGYDLWVGGGLSTAPRLAKRLGAFVTEEQAADVWYAVTRAFRDYGYRRQRNRARLKFLIDDWGTEKFRQVIQDEYLGYELADGPAPAQPKTPGDHVGIHLQKDGRYYIGASPKTGGRVGGDLLTRLADLVDTLGADAVRFTPHQKLVLFGIPAEKLDEAVAGLEELGLATKPSLFRRHTMACTGIEFCKLAIVDTKDTATATVNELEKRLVDIEDQLTTPIAMNLNGCPNSCARIQTADLGLKGQIVTTDEGERVPGYQVHFGGGLKTSDRQGDAELGRTVRGLKVTADELPDFVERVVRRYVATRINDAETFAVWSHRVDDEELK